MAKEASFDVVSEVDAQEVRNAVDQTRREVGQRFDFKNTGSTVELTEDGSGLAIVVRSNTDAKLRDVVRVLEEKLVRRSVPLKALQPGPIEQAAGGTARRRIAISQGISSDKARELVKAVKNMKVKAQVAVQGDQVRVSSKSIDTLQEVIATLKERDFGIPLQFVNFRSN